MCKGNIVGSGEYIWLLIMTASCLTNALLPVIYSLPIMLYIILLLLFGKVILLLKCSYFLIDYNVYFAVKFQDDLKVFYPA